MRDRMVRGRRRAALRPLAVLLGLFLGLSPVRALAETLPASQDWKVAFTAEEKMESNFKTSDLDEAVGGLQPGDNIIFTLALSNEHPETTDWYMTNKVLYSLEDRSANSATGGGAYTYRLNYTNAAGETTVLFDSDTVGGEDVSAAGEGLHEATDALQDYFYLDTLTTGQSGRITLEVALDGETQGNDYQDTLADLQMNFAVELGRTAAATQNPQRDDNTPGTSTRTQVVKTGDENDTWLFALMTAGGVVFLVLAFLGWRRQQTEEDAAPAGGSGKSGKKRKDSRERRG